MVFPCWKLSGSLCAARGYVLALILYSGRSHGDAGKLYAAGACFARYAHILLVIEAFFLFSFPRVHGECRMGRFLLATTTTAPDFITKELSWSPPPQDTHVDARLVSLLRPACAEALRTELLNLLPRRQYVSLLVTSIERAKQINNPTVLLLLPPRYR